MHNLQVFPNNSILSSLPSSEMEDIYIAEYDGHLHPRPDFSKILLRCTFLLVLVEDALAGFFFSSLSYS